MNRALAAVVTTALVAALPAAGAEPRRAALELEAAAPLRVSGHGFGPREAVLLTYVPAEGRNHVVRARATRQGGFLVAFKLRPRRCESFTVRASGSAGSRAVLQVERRCEQTKGPPKRAPRDDGSPDD